MAELLRFNPYVRVYPFDSSASAPMFACEVPTRSAGTPNRYVVPSALLELLRMFTGDDSTDKVLADWIGEHGQYRLEKLRWLIHRYFLPRGLLIDGHNALPPRKSATYMYLKLTLLPARVVAPLSQCLSWLFNRGVMLSLVPLIVMAQALFFGYLLPKYNFNLSSLSGLDFLVVINLATVFGLVHELGHATALHHFGQTRASIGWGMYLNFTVLYTDLSDVWRLRRSQRALVDAGGIYFHSISLLGLAGLILWTKMRYLVYCFFFIDLQIAGALNPFLRMDGYWLLADLLGIADLRGEVLRLVRHLTGKHLGGRRSPAPASFRLAPWKAVFLAAYGLTGGLFAIALYRIVFVQLVFKVLPSYPELLLGCARAVTEYRWLDMLNQFGEIAWKGLALYGLARMVWTFLRFVFRSAGKVGAVFARNNDELLSQPATEEEAG